MYTCITIWLTCYRWHFVLGLIQIAGFEICSLSQIFIPCEHKSDSKLHSGGQEHVHVCQHVHFFNISTKTMSVKVCLILKLQFITIHTVIRIWLSVNSSSQIFERTCSYPVYFHSANRTSGTGLMPMCQRGLYLLLEEPETYTQSAQFQPSLLMIIMSTCIHFVSLSVSYAISSFWNITVISTNASSALFIFQSRYSEKFTVLKSNCRINIV